MMGSSGDKVEDTLQKLAIKMEELDNRKGFDQEKLAALTDTLDRTLVLLTRLEEQQKAEQEINGKLDQLSGKLESIYRVSEEKAVNNRPVIENIKHYVGYGKMAGQAIQTVADCLCLILDTVHSTVLQNAVVPKAAAVSPPVSGGQDLSGLLSSINEMVKGLTSTMEKKK